MKIKFRNGSRGYFVQAEGKEWGQVEQRGVGMFGKPVWVVTEVREKRVRIDGPSLWQRGFKTRREAAEALIETTKRTLEVAS